MIPFIKTALAATNSSVPNTPFGGGAAPTLIPKCALRADGADNLECVLELFVNISQVLLGVVGSVLLVVFVYGGLMYIFSQGEPGRVAKAQKALTGGVVGMLIVFSAFAGVSFAVSALRGEPDLVASEYVTCGVTEEEQAAANTLQCAPGEYFCSNGACCPSGNCTDPNADAQTSITPENT